MKRIFILLALFGAARPALACGTCTASIVDSFAPPVQWWIILSFTWFLAHGVIRTFTKAPLPAQPGLPGSIGLALAAAVVASAIAGPLVVPFLMIPPLVATVLAFRSNPFPGRLAVRIVGGLHMAALLAGLVMMAYILRTRTEGEFIVQWEGAAMGESRLHRLQKEEPRSLPTYRYLVEHGGSRMVAKAAARIAVAGSPEVDVPILEKALRRSSNEPRTAESINDALAALKSKTRTPAAKLELKPCTTIPGLPPEARCGTYEVWENRAAQSGRKIPLRVVVIPAQGPDRLSDPFIYFEGGPGQSSVAAASLLVQELGALRQRRDILLVDFRGTGGSAGLFCPELQSGGAQGFLDDFYPPAQVKACAERLAKTADLRQYTNDSSVDDVEEVRAALGYGKLNIFGASGGTRAALVYLRRHPESVRTLTLSGVLPLDERGPLWMARNAQWALDGLIAECAEDKGCHAAFPKLRDDVAAVLRQVEKEPVTVPLLDGRTGKPVDIRLTRNGVAQMLRYMLYNAPGASLLPLNVHLAAQGDWKPMAENARRFAGHGGTAMADGYYLSLTCSEDVPFLEEDKIPAAVQGTFLGDLRIRKQQAACAVWPVPPVSRGFLAPVTSDVPVLLTSGGRDPATPPANAERVARTLKNSLHAVVPDGGHVYNGVAGASECIGRLIVGFVEAGSVQGLDTSCLTRTRRPDFVLHRDPEVSLPAEQLARLTGTYKDRESGYAIRVEPLGNHLRAMEAGEDTAMVLAATSPTRFRIESMTGTATFQLSDGKATAVLLEQPGTPSLLLLREGS